MTTASDLVAFGEALSALDLTETDLAVALLWFFEQHGEPEASATKLANAIHDLSLRPRVNASRLAGKLASHPDVVRGHRRSDFKLKLSRKTALTTEYAPFLKRPKAKVDDLILPSEDFVGTRSILEKIVWQINGTYQYGFYDGCIVLCRRLMEILLIEAFEQKGHGADIKRDGEYVALGDIIAKAKSGTPIKLARGTGKSLDQIKVAGDTGAHNRSYITKKHDIDDLKLELRRVVSELMSLAKIAPKP